MSSRTETLASRVTARFAEQLRALPVVAGDVAYRSRSRAICAASAASCATIRSSASSS